MKKKNGTDGQDGAAGGGILLRSALSICFAIFFLAFPTLVGADLALGQTPAIRWVADPADAQRITVEIVGVNADGLRRLQQGGWRPAQWRQLFAVYAGQADTAMAGEYRIRDGVLQFEPRFPFDPGLSYRAEFHPAHLPGGRANARPAISRFRLPPRDLTPTTSVIAVYPSADVVPENLLKFYLHFSAPMQRGEIYEHIQLRDSAGRLVELPFLEIGRASCRERV